jgi:hypothetical protein
MLPRASLCVHLLSLSSFLLPPRLSTFFLSSFLSNSSDAVDNDRLLLRNDLQGMGKETVRTRLREEFTFRKYQRNRERERETSSQGRCLGPEKCGQVPCSAMLIGYESSGPCKGLEPLPQGTQSTQRLSVRQSTRFRHYDTSRKVAGSNLCEVTEFFNWNNCSSGTTALGSTVPLA